MSGYRGLDGQLIMAGSPDLDMIFADCDVPALLKGINGVGKPASIIVGLARLREVALANQHQDLAYRCDLVEKLIVAAQRLITWPMDKETTVANAKRAVEILDVKD
jgi:hypothetical protein